jgi:hypothetical protein
MTTPVGSSGDPMFALAALLVERDDQRMDADDQNLRAARAEEQRALAAQVHALREAADDIRVGGLVQGLLTVASGSMTAVGHAIGPACDAQKSPGLKAFMAGSEALGQLAGPAGRLTGDAARADDEADAKQAEARGSAANARAEEAERHRDRLEQNLVRSLDAIDQSLDSQAQGNLAIIANV